MCKNSFSGIWRSAIFSVAVSVAAAMAVSCNGNENDVPDSPIGGGIEFSSESVSIPIDGEATVSLTVTPIERLSDVEVSVADDEVVSLVSDTDDKGYVFSLKANALGSTTIVAVLDGDIARCSVSVEPISVTGILLDKTSLHLLVGDSETLSATILPDNATSPSVSWDTSDKEVVLVENGVVTAVGAGTATVTATSSSFVAECAVEVSTVEAESLTFDVSTKELTEEESFIINAVVLPENVTSKEVEWAACDATVISIEPFDAKESDNIVSAKVTAIKAGATEITATIGEVSAKCSVSVKSKVLPVAPVKIGDYFYSDGTWSDGGLISINSDGTDPVWASVKPAPIEGKTVIGIVFQTDSARFSELERQQGYTHGLVFCTKGAHAPDAKLTRYAMSEEPGCVSYHKLGSSYYNDIYGQLWTARIKDTFPGAKLQQYPAFDWTLTDFVPAAPANTSGWFVPSIGQLWDFMANMAGEEVAEHLLSLRDYGYDVTYFGEAKLSYNPMDAINSHFSKIPADQKEDLVYSLDRGNWVCELMSSTMYSEEACCIFWLEENCVFQPYCEWIDAEFVCHPVLAF